MVYISDRVYPLYGSFPPYPPYSPSSYAKTNDDKTTKYIFKFNPVIFGKK